MNPLQPLPIDHILHEVSAALRKSSSAVLIAPPGSGKTTRVAPYLLSSQDIVQGKKIFLLQPRRIATRATAQRIASEQGWELGQKVGYQVRFESRVRKETPLIVATEGILLRRMQYDPCLEDVGLVILDEFHERSLQADLLLGMLRRVQTAMREDLRILVMSATIDPGPIQGFFGNCPAIHSDGSLFPVEVEYRPIPRVQSSLTEHVAETIMHVVDRNREPGDILVFLPGVGEIQRVMGLLDRQKGLAEWSILPLHGSLPLEEQARAIPKGKRPRIVLATNVAETSLTLEGIRTVIDSGVARVLRFDSQVGLDRLVLEPICKASAAQRAGRAGRLSSGHCIRLWDPSSQGARSEFLEPEIRRVDLSSAMLQLIEWGEGDGSDFPWLTVPRSESVEQSIRLLERLGAIQQNRLTEMGKTMARISVAPRLARLLIEGHRRNVLREVGLIAAMLSERDPFQRAQSNSSYSHSSFSNSMATRASSHRWDSDVLERLHAIHEYDQTGNEETMFGRIHRNGLRTIREVADSLVDETIKELGDPVEPGFGVNESLDISIMKSLLAAFPDRVAKRRIAEKPKGLMTGGRGVQLAPSSGVAAPELFLCIDVDSAGTEALVRQASRVDEQWLAEEDLGLSHLLEIREELFFHPSQLQVVARRRRYFDDLVLSESPTSVSDQEAASKLLFENAVQNLDKVLPADQSAFESLRIRSQCLRDWAPELNFPALDRELIERVLRQLCQNHRSFSDLRSAAWLDWIQGEWTSEQRSMLEREVPERMQVPSGNRVRIHYEIGKPPILAVRIQEVFSWQEVPKLAFGRIPILLHLLAPNMRPQQITDDLKSFWTTTYQVVRKELRRRYPKHSWPEDPWTAKPPIRDR